MGRLLLTLIVLTVFVSTCKVEDATITRKFTKEIMTSVSPEDTAGRWSEGKNKVTMSYELSHYCARYGIPQDRLETAKLDFVSIQTITPWGEYKSDLSVIDSINIYKLDKENNPSLIGTYSSVPGSAKGGWINEWGKDFLDMIEDNENWYSSEVKPSQEVDSTHVFRIFITYELKTD